MDNNVTPMRPDPGAQASGKQPDPDKQASSKATFTWFIEYGPILLIALAVLSLTCAVAIVKYAEVSEPLVTLMKNQPPKDLPLETLMNNLGFYETLILTLCCQGWVIAMGSMGGAASLGMQAIKVPEDEPIINLSDKQLTILRVTLGGLFALVLTFAFESDCFIDICHRIATGGEFAKDKESPFVRAFVLMLPFLIGFSTSLVMMVINQLRAGVLAFFGRLGPASGTQVTMTPAAAEQAGQK